MHNEGDEALPLAETLDRVSEGVVVLDTDLVYTYANERALELVGRERDEFVGEYIWDVFPGAEGTRAGERIAEAIETGEEVTYERYNEDLEQWFEARVYPDNDGATLFFRDVTDQKEHEQDLERYEHIVENLPVAVGQNVADDDDDHFTYVNETMVEMFDGESKAEIRAHAVNDIYADPERGEEITRELGEQAIVEGVEARFETFGGEEFWGALTATLQSVDGTREFLGILEDITERKERERRIRRLHEATRDLLSADSQAGVAERTCDAAVEILGLDLNAVHLYDASADGLVPTAVSESVRGIVDDPPVLDQGLAWEAFEAGESRLHSDMDDAENGYDGKAEMGTELYLPLGEHGVLILCSTEVAAFDDADVALAKLLASNATAVMGQVATEQSLRERERELQRAETLFENAQDAFFLVDVDSAGGEFVIDRVNPAYESLTGLAKEEIEGEEIEEIFGETTGNEIERRYRRCVERREPMQYVEELPLPEEGSYWETRIAPVVVDDEVVQIVGATRDITERKVYEQQLEEQRDNLELLNQMVRHDIRNDLQVVASYAELLATRVDAEDREYVERILNNAETAVELTRTARDLAETMLQTDANTEPVPLRQVLLAQIDEIRTTYTDAIVTIDGEIPGVAVAADDLLASVFRNVIKNAIQHNDKDVPEVSVSVADRDDHVRVSVADNGPGVPDEQKAEIFGKGEKGLESEGTGIGLYLVNTLVERYGGDVQVHDNEPEGTVVSVALQRA